MRTHTTSTHHLPHPFSKPLTTPTTPESFAIHNKPLILTKPSLFQRIKKIEADLPFTPPLSPGLHVEIIRSVLARKGKSYRPRHGWQAEAQLPQYNVICYASSGFKAFLGPDQSYFSVLKNEWPELRIMYQRVSEHSHI